MARAVENPHLKRFNSQSSSDVSSDSKYCFQDVGILPPPKRMRLMTWDLPLPPSPPSSPVNDDNTDQKCISGLPYDVPLPPRPPPSEKKYASLRSLEHERSYLMPLSLLANIPLLPSPPLSPVFAEYSDSRCISPLPHEVPLPPSPPLSPVFSEYSDSRCISPLPHEVPLPPSPPLSPVFSEYSDSRCISPLPHEVPLPPSPPPADAWPQSKDTHKVLHPDLKYDRSSLDDEVAFFMCPTEKPPGVTALDVSPRPLYEFPHLSEKRCLNLSTVAFLCLDD
ncbi:formin-like protein 5 isoform X4 [Astatotilapia calliptera]|uniref:formin-like protein 5 isoform X4 n=1 Tax=Astatotilapia calliptera TaxID=8154 RepID=UPI000E401B09|nr:formin-like protein 5 isoform X4 [Astatotilapia calliptera]